MQKDDNETTSNEEEIYGLEKAVDTAWDTLTQQSADEIVKRTLSILGETSDSFLLNFLGEEYTILLSEKQIMTKSGEPLYNLFKVGIMLHYLVHARDKPLANKFISFRELWGGNEYYYAFNNRVLKPLINHFSQSPEQLITAGLAVGGEKINKSEYGITIPALPRVPITVLFWSGDSEVEASGNLIFDASANGQMETEGLVWLSIATVSELRKVIPSFHDQ